MREKQKRRYRITVYVDIDETGLDDYGKLQRIKEEVQENLSLGLHKAEEVLA